jgi:L-2-hydroxyglutarate oxidase LhgO
MGGEGWDYDVAVVGGGVVGLAAAARLAEAGLAVVLLERHPGPGRETTSRNSEVIHAGIYYPPGSLKARSCVRGNQLLYDFCRRARVEHRRLGKLIVATDPAELPELERLLAVGQQNGARELRLVERDELQAMEPKVVAVAGLYSPSTGIVDTHGLVKALEARVQAAGGLLAYRCLVTGVGGGPGFVLTVDDPSGTEQLGARTLVNAAGLESDRVSAMAGVDAYRLHWCKGDYFAVTGPPARLISRLVYPVPGSRLTSLGIHLTLDLAGRMRLGPDATYLEDRRQASLDVDPDKAVTFHRAVRRFLPGLEAAHLQPDTSGIRPKLQGPDDPWRDFVLREESDHGRPGLVNLVGIESPGLTSSLDLADRILELIYPYFQ